VMAASAIGAGEWLLGPTVTAKYGGALMWLAGLSIVMQSVYNLEICRYTLYCGEPIFSGKFRTLPGPWFWLFVYLVLDFSAVFSFHAASAAVPIEVILLGGNLPDQDHNSYHWWLHKAISTVIFLLGTTPLIFGGKIFSALKVIMSTKLVLLFSFLIILGCCFSKPATWADIWGGFLQIGNVPVQRGEDRNGNGRLDAGEDWDSDGHLDVVENWKPGGSGDVDGDGKRDGDNIENVFVERLFHHRWPKLDFTLVAFICGLAAIAGNGGLSNTPMSNYVRDQGWGMGHSVGAIPSMIGGHGIALTHVGSVFEVNDNSLSRWRRWYRHVARDQLAIWLPACLVGVALPSMLSVEFLPRGTEAGDWNSAVMAAGGVRDHVTSPPPGVFVSAAGLAPYLAGPVWGQIFWALTLLCGFLVITTTLITTIDGLIRRWVDIFWTASPSLRALPSENIRYVYFAVLISYVVFAVALLWLNKPAQLITWATLGFNFALGFSAWHTLAINHLLLPRQLRPGLVPTLGLLVGGLFFSLLGVVAVLDQLQKTGLIRL